LHCVAAALHFYFVDISENFRRISAEKFYGQPQFARKLKIATKHDYSEYSGAGTNGAGWAQLPTQL